MLAQSSPMTREQVIREVIDLVLQLPAEKLASLYQYGLFIQSQPAWTSMIESNQQQDDIDLAEEFALWEDASDKDWLKIENLLKESI